MTYGLYGNPYEYDPMDDVEDPKMTNYQYDDGKSFMEGIIEHVYGEGDLNVDLLEHCIEELAHLFRLSLPRKDLQIIRKPQQKTNDFFFEYAANLSRSYL